MNRRDFLRLNILGIMSTLLGCQNKISTGNNLSKPNVLFIAVDDLNDWIGCLGGHPDVRTPNIDRLAKKGCLFTNAHCAAPVCNPSRTAIFTGLRPSTSGVYLNPQDQLRKIMPDVITLPQYFKENSYQVMGHGKLFHQHHGDYPQSWDEYTWIWPNNVPEGRPGDWRIDGGPLDINDDEMADGKTAAWAVRQLKRKYDKPFFLGVGIFRPHLDWFVPQKYFDMYPPEKVSLPEVNENDLDDVPPIGREIAESIGDYGMIKKTSQWRKAVTAYLACVSFADAMIGRVLSALEKSPYADNTIVVLWGDHGWHLGQKLHWRKFTLWEEGTKCPFIIYAPGITKPNSRCDRTVSLIDIYPTLVDICHLPPKSDLEGQSLKRLLKNPQAKWNIPALTTYGRNNHSLRSDRYRYIRYSDGTEELYDHKTDKFEWHNLAENTKYSKIKKKLAKWLPETNAPNAPGRKGNTDVKLWHIRFSHLRNKEIKLDF